MARTIGFDVSHWAGEVDFEKAKQGGMEFVFIKAAQGERPPHDGFLDSHYVHNWIKVQDSGLLYGPYFFADYRYSWRDQADYFAEVWNDHPGTLPPVLDYEHRENVWGVPDPRSRNTVWVSQFVQHFRTVTGIAPVLYINRSMAKHHLVNPGNDLTSLDLWTAQYPWAMTPVSRPVADPWDTWKFWQWSDRGSGSRYGVESRSIDMNYFNGTVEELNAYSLSRLYPHEVINPLTIAEKVDILWQEHLS